MGSRNHRPDHDREEWQRSDEWLTPADLDRTRAIDPDEWLTPADLAKEPHPTPPLTRDGGERPTTTKEADR